MNKDHITGRRHYSPKRGKLLPLALMITFGLLSLHGCGDNVGGEASLLRQGVGGEASLLRQNIGGEASSFAKTVQPTTAQMVADSSRQSSAKTARIKTAELRRPDMKVRVRRGDRLVLRTEGLTLTAEDSAVARWGQYSVTALHAEELPPMPEGMVNVTLVGGGLQRSEAGGFRLLPSGRNFSHYAELRVAYDEARLPFGYTPDDIYTSYYDEATRQWVRLQRVAVDTASHEIVSLTDHFTDFVNEVLKAPEMPETQAFVPTMMSDIEAANPLEGLPLFQPPTASPDGTASLSYPIWTPRGRNGMQPSLALTYSSAGGTSWLGTGWDLSVPSITLDTRWGVPRYSTTHETETYLLGGEQLVNKYADGSVIPLPHRTNQQQSRQTGEVRFFARTGDAHDSIVRHGDGPRQYWWEVTDRTGVTHYYGRYPDEGMNAGNPATLTDDRGNIARWMLCESRDPDNNWVRYFYAVDSTPGANPGRQIYLDSISYTGHGSEEGVYSVAFELRDRDVRDRPVSCGLGFKEETARQLCLVTVRTSDSILTAYHFETECGYQSNFKIRLTAVTKIDNMAGAVNFWDALKNVCSNGVGGLACGMVRQEFAYYDAPAMDTLFGAPRTSVNAGDGVKGFMLTPRHRIDSVNRATGLGLSHTSGWSVGGTLGAGLGPDVWQTSNSVGGNYHRNKSTSETLMTLVDLDGDGLADKVFVRGGKMYWRKQTLTMDGVILFGEARQVSGAEHFLVEGSTSNTIGVQASVLSVASGSGAWTKTTSTTATYLADIDGDGLTDIVDNGEVLFNSLHDGQPTFARYRPADGQAGGEQPDAATAPCGGIIFDGEVDDEVGCRVIWHLVDVSGPMTKDSAESRAYYNPGSDAISMGVVTKVGGAYYIYAYRGMIDCSGRNLAMDGVPSTEAIRVWVSPGEGPATVRYYVKLIEDNSDRRRLSRHADGISYVVQHSSGVDTVGGTLRSAVDSLLAARHICADCYRTDNFVSSHYDTTINVQLRRGDLLLFRLQSGGDSQFDDIEDHVEITFGDRVYRSEDGFMLTDEKHFQAPYDGEYWIDGTYSNPVPAITMRVSPTGGVVPHGSGQLNLHNTIPKDSAIRITLTTTDPDADWSGVDVRARIRFRSDSLPDTVTVWTPGDRQVVHPSGSVWGDPVYQLLFGKLPGGWGQFAYHPTESVTGSQLIRPASLKAPVQSLSSQTRDTSGLRGRINTPVPDTAFNQPAIDDFTDAFGSQYSVISDSSCWVPMTADARHGRWVAYGAQSSMARDTMSNSLQEWWYSSVGQVSADSSAHLASGADYDDAIPAPTDGTPVKAVRKASRSSNQSYTLGIAGFSGSYSNGSNTVEMDCLDLNGDRYPDIVGPSFVQYRSQWGGLGEKTALPVGIADVTTSVTNSAGVGFGASPVHHERVISGSPAKGKFTLNGDGSLSGDVSVGWDHATGSWTDINGDGLPDHVTQEGEVRLNTGYSFLDAEDWDFDDVHSGQSASASISLGLSGAFNKFNKTQGSIELGAGLSRSVNRTGRTLMDVNGDGLPDMVWRNVVDIDIDDWDDLLHPVDSVHVRLNLGGGRWSQTYDMNIKNFNWSEGYNESLNVGATLGFSVMGVFKVTAGVNGTPYSGGTSRDRMQLVDVDGDGLPDLVTSSGEGELTVRRHRGGRTNLLRTVTNFTGSRIHLTYTLSKPDRSQPSRSWLLTQVATKDPLNPNGGDTTVTRFAYASPHYDRLERTSYGYGTVVTSQVDPSDNTVYRTVRRDFLNGNILEKGRPRREQTCDGHGNRYVEKEYRYDYAAYDGGAVDTCSGNAYSLRDRIVTRFYEGTSSPLLTTAEAYEYDRYHNVTAYFDEGDTAYGDDGLRMEMTYLAGQPHNLIGLRGDCKVYATGASGSGWMRHMSYEYWPDGRLKRQTLHGTAVASVFDFEYDGYGNLAKAMRPQNDSLQRMTFRYTYDGHTHTYPVKIKNSHGDSVQTDYLLPYGKPVRVTDPGGSAMLYTYDNAGRLRTVTSPLCSSATPSLVNEYYPINYYNSNPALTYSISTRPYAVTAHYDDHGGLVTLTVVIADGFGRVIQTKKGLTSGGQQKLQVSGREFTDPFGRATGRHDPFAENLGTAPGLFNPHISMLVDTIHHDILDRETEVRQPSFGYTTTKQYGVQDDASSRRRFTTAVTDPNSHTTVLYNDHDGRQVQVDDALGGSTLSAYDALGQLTSSTDPEGFSTAYTYDRLGRMTQREHPDAGTTRYYYDPAGNLTKETNPLGTISYDYTYQRLAHKRYSNIMENNVTYTYGTDGTERGRPVRIVDGTGERLLSYDALGNVVSEERTVALPGTPEVYTFVTKYSYDSWGRMLEMTYPDDETVTYTYCFGGDLLSMYGDKGAAHHDYVLGITYNDFGQRSHIAYANGASAGYTYDALHRLSQLTSISPSGGMQRLDYATDGVGNITQASNSAAPIGPLGGAYTNLYHYDALNRLTHSNETAMHYNILMDYSPSGRLVHKQAASNMTFPLNIDAFFGYCNDKLPHAPKRIYDIGSRTLTELLWDGAGNLAQVNTATEQCYDGSRFLFWTEDSRLHTVADDGWHSYYAYDHAGERTLKLTGKSFGLDINSDLMYISSTLDAPTLYPSPYMVVTDKGYTKHYYVGADRLCARIGGGGLPAASQNSVLSNKANNLYNDCVNQITGRLLDADSPECIRGLVWDDDILRQKIKGAPSKLKVNPVVKLTAFVQSMTYYATHNNPEHDVYFYHGDHLGSASWITDRTGTPVQHLQYLPFGEPYVNQRAAGSTYDERFTFTAKERDTETGYGYFGARYYDPDISAIWLSVDPMADKYPGISPYAYCAWNPVKLIDPDGRDVWEIDSKGNIVSRTVDKTRDAFYMVNNKGERMEDACIEFDYGTVTQTKTLSLDGGLYDMYQIKGDDNGTSLFEFLADNSEVEWSHIKTGKEGGNAQNFITTSHSKKDEKGSSHLWSNRLKYGYTVREMNHSHPSGIPIPSGMPGTAQFSKGDISFATTVSRHYNRKGINPPMFNVYNCNGGYVPYSKSSVVSDYSKTMELYGVTFKNGQFFR